ncbi:uncharacterized protein LOC108808447 [Raphanus sativus]|uniref:Uncharacterized protein LOC108808447 n=1 Tax=Raphanus sativus TaxID=3726 RepID=A0A6J0JKC8_RAPSA|nr:uncharacterized protein LOC108808447 [Raphanus sativus]
MVSLTEVNVKMETMEKRLDGIEKSQRVLKEKAKKTRAMEKRLNATEKSQSVMKRKIVKMAWKLKGMKEYAVEKGQDIEKGQEDMGFDNLDMGFYNQDSNRKGAEEKEEEQARTKDAEMVDATQDQETQVQKEVEEEVEEEVQEEVQEEEEEEVEEEIIEARFGEAEKEPEEAEKEPEEAEKEPEKAEKEPEDEECMNYTEEEKAGWILTIFKSFDGIFSFSRARFVDGTSGTPAHVDHVDGTPPAQMDGTPPAQTDGTPPALVVTPPTPGTPLRGRTKAMASKKGGVNSPATGRRKPLNPHKFTTPPPEKRVRVPSQWLSSPFMEVNTEEIEGPKKKPKTKP